MVEQITAYLNAACPYAARVEIALTHVNAKYTRVEIDLQNKPEWYPKLVNPAGKVPSIAYGGPPSEPSNPSPESAKLYESLVLLEFVADIFPEANLLPSDPVRKAKARLFIDAVTNKFAPASIAALMHGKGPEAYFEGVDAVVALVPPGKPYVGGDQLSIADISILPFFAHMEIALSNGIGNYAAGEGKAAWNKLQTEDRFARFREYYGNLKEQEAFKKGFNFSHVTEMYHKHDAILKTGTHKIA